MACADERAEPWNSKGAYTIWNFALENPYEKMNYGVYVNGGLLVESCSIYVLKNKSNMVLSV
jgi:acyl-ACP thioesterase